MPLRPRLTSQTRPRRGLVIGGTGATGRFVIKELLESDNWDKVVYLGRSSFSKFQETLAINSEAWKKLEEHVTPNFEEELVSMSDKFRGIDTVFNCIGTTRSQAGSADRFVAIELGITEKVAAASKEADVNHVSVVSATGANSKIPGIKLIHPLLYANTLGRKEDAFTQENFPHISIYRPGMLKRPGSNRSGEKFFEKIVTSLPTEVLAKAMVRDAENVPLKSGSENAKTSQAEVGASEPVYYQGNGVITAESKL